MSYINVNFNLGFIDNFDEIIYVVGFEFEYC